MAPPPPQVASELISRMSLRMFAGIFGRLTHRPDFPTPICPETSAGGISSKRAKATYLNGRTSALLLTPLLDGFWLAPHTDPTVKLLTLPVCCTEGN